MTKPLALTLGEPAGIGPDIAILSWVRRDELSLPPFYLVGEATFIRDRAKLLGASIDIAEVKPETAAEAFADAMPIVALGQRITARPGSPDATSAPAAIGSIRQAVSDVAADKAAAVVTNPIAKSVLYEAGFEHPGHTEFLAELVARDGRPPMPVMLLWSPTLAVVPVTIHLSVRDAVSQLTTDLIVKTTRIVAADLVKRFGVRRPRLAISGLNPHAGEGGALGDEEQTIIGPAIETLRGEGVDVVGPLPADTMFHEAARKNYDCAICMYHDQALIPIKTLAFDTGVNVTLGLPIVRTSPDHGTAFDIAGTGRASPASLIAALRLAAKMTGATASQ